MHAIRGTVRYQISSGIQTGTLHVGDDAVPCLSCDGVAFPGEGTVWSLVNTAHLPRLALFLPAFRPVPPSFATALG